jgi:hypothetical protein
MKAYLEKCGKEWFDDYVYLARQPLEDRGFQIVPFDGTFLDEFIERTVFDKNDVIVGSVEATKAFWDAVGIKSPYYIGYPKCLSEFYGREIKSTRFGKITVDDLPIFIKPRYDVKLFTGFVLDKNTTLNNISTYYSDVNANTAVYTSEPIDIISEYRCFVHKNKLVGIKNYDGDFETFPSVQYIHKMIESYKDEAPVSYTLDVGIVESGKIEYYNSGELNHQKELVGTLQKTLLIEINDFWAIGGYGLDGKTYCRMLVDRFQEIKNKNEN